MMKAISVRGARTHNLKNVSLDIPRDKLTVITGLSGSGKSSLAFDTLYAEGQRRYVESISAYARQFLELRPRPDVDGVDDERDGQAEVAQALGESPGDARVAEVVDAAAEDDGACGRKDGVGGFGSLGHGAEALAEA